MPVKQCALCASQDLALIIDLGLHPLADTFMKSKAGAGSLPRYPLTVLRCLSCGHAMNGYRVPPEQRYQETEYSYDSANSDVAVAHFFEFARDVGRFAKLGPQDLVVDIGGNIGTLLRAFRDQFRAGTLNVEPSHNIAMISVENGIETAERFWDHEIAMRVAKEGGAKIITATNLLNHIDNLDIFFDDIMNALEPEGVFVAEVPYLLTLIERDAFDTMYLEHVSYFSVQPLRHFLAARDLRIMDVQIDEYMGGSIRFVIGRGVEGAEVAKLSKHEQTFGLGEEQIYERFRARVRRFRENLLDELHTAKATGGLIMGIGAATKGNTLLNYCGIDDTILDCVTDVSPLKIGKYTPGSAIAIKGDEVISDQVTHALVLPWNIADFLTRKLSRQHPHLSFIVPHMVE
ncbi:MAG: class I SAM-dependent methyltransferase [Patescibacteria group bacterium]